MKGRYVGKCMIFPSLSKERAPVCWGRLFPFVVFAYVPFALGLPSACCEIKSVIGSVVAGLEEK